MFSRHRLITLDAVYCVVIFILVVDLNFAVGKRLAKNVSAKSSNPSSGKREGKYLVFPTPGSFVPTKVQLITGLGLPMEIGANVIIGYVMKFNYVLPYNASYLTHLNALSYDRSVDPLSSFDKHAKEERDTKEEEKLDRRGSIPRWEIYRVIESALNGFQISGKGCLLRTICQVAGVPFEDNGIGLMAELIHVLLTPSTTQEKYGVSGDQEYHSAEAAGRNNPGECENMFPECDVNLLEYFTETKVIEQV